METTHKDANKRPFQISSPRKQAEPPEDASLSVLGTLDGTLNRSKSSKLKLYFYTALIFFSYTTYGIAYNIWGPTWIDLISLLQSSQEQMSYGGSLMAIGYIIGSFSSPFLFDYFGRQIFIAVYLLLISISIFVTPLFANYYVFLGMALLFGIGEGGFDTGINSWTLEMWLDDNGPVMQTMYFFYGLGTVCSPLIALSFLSDDNFIDANDQTLQSGNQLNGTMRDSTLSGSVSQMGSVTPHHGLYLFPLLRRDAVLGDIVQSSSIEIPYIIVSALLLVTAIMHALCHFLLRYEADENATIMRLKNEDHSLDDTQVFEKSKCISEVAHCSSSYGTIEPKEEGKSEEYTVNHSRRKLFTLVSIGAAMCCFYDGMENISFEYMTSFLVNTSLAISETEAAKLVSLMSVAYTLARGAGIVVIMKVSPKLLLLLNLALIFTGITLLFYSMDTSETGLLLGLVMLGLGFATFMPCLFSYIEEHIRLTNSLCALLSLSCALISTVDPIIVGHLISTLPAIVLYINYASLMIVAIAFALFEVVAMC